MPRKRKKQYGDGTIYKDPKTGRYIVQIYSNGRSIRRRAADPETAEAIRKELIAQRDAGIDMQASSQSFESFANVWYNQVACQRSLKPTTLIRYQKTIEYYLLPHLGSFRLDAIRPQDIQLCLNRLRQHLASATVSHAYTLLIDILDTAEQWEYILRNPARRVDRPAHTPTKRNALTIEEMHLLCDAWRDTRLCALFEVASTLGLRLGELLGLYWRNISYDTMSLTIAQQIQYLDGERGFAELQPKSNSGVRTLPLTPRLAEHLRAHWTRQHAERTRKGVEWKEHGLVFPTTAGRPLAQGVVVYGLQDACQRAGVRRITPHYLRHTAATRLAESGAEDSTIGAVLGHHGLTTFSPMRSSVTGGYIHLGLAAMRDAIQRAEALTWDKAA